MHVQCCDVTYDVTALINDVRSKNKMMCFGCGVSKVHPQKIAKKMAVE